MNYDKWKTKLMAVSPVTDETQLNRRLPGRSKYAPSSLAALPFEGISVIHNIDAETASDLGLSQMAEQLRSRMAGAGVASKVAFVDTSTFHATTFDLINDPEHAQKLAAAGYSYANVREQVEIATKQFLADIKLTIVATVTVTGVGMFSPNVVKLNLRFHDFVSMVFQAFRLGLHRCLLDQVDGYSTVRGEDWNSMLAGHITIGYVVDRMTEQEIDALIAVLKDFNTGFTPIEFGCSQGQVTAFSDMDHYTPV